MSIMKKIYPYSDPGPEKNRPPKKRPVGKTGPKRMKTLPFLSSHIKENLEVDHFYIKSRCVQGLVIEQITFEKCTTKFYFENGKLGIKAAIAIL